MLHDKGSSGEGQGRAASHSEAAGNKVKVWEVGEGTKTVEE
jgi:hypothetical protein